MKRETKYAYEKRIRELERELIKANNELYLYRTAALEIYDGVCEAVKNNEAIGRAWIMQKLKKCFR